MSGIKIYTRVSTRFQAESKNGLEAQLKACEDYAERLQIPVEGIYTDSAVSGAAELSERPELMDAINSLKKGDILVVAKRDRIARDVLLNAVIEKMVSDRKASIHAADGAGNGDDPSAELMRNILAAMAAYEKAIISLRTKAAMKAMKRAGKVYGKIPFGYRRDGSRFISDERESAILSDVASWREAKTTWSKCAARLNASGRFNRAGNDWSLQNLSQVVKRSCAA